MHWGGTPDFIPVRNLWKRLESAVWQHRPFASGSLGGSDIGSKTALIQYVSGKFPGKHRGPRGVCCPGCSDSPFRINKESMQKI